MLMYYCHPTAPHQSTISHPCLRGARIVTATSEKFSQRSLFAIAFPKGAVEGTSVRRALQGKENTRMWQILSLLPRAPTRSRQYKMGGVARPAQSGVANRTPNLLPLMAAWQFCGNGKSSLLHLSSYGGCFNQNFAFNKLSIPSLPPALSASLVALGCAVSL